MSSLSVSVPNVVSVSQCGRVCVIVGGCALMCVCPSVGGCVLVWEGVWDVCVCVHACICVRVTWEVCKECVQVYVCMSVIVTCTYLCINM